MNMRAIRLYLFLFLHGYAVRIVRERIDMGTMKITVLVGKPNTGVWPCAVTVNRDTYKVEYMDSGESVRTASEVLYSLAANL